MIVGKRSERFDRTSETECGVARCLTTVSIVHPLWRFKHNEAAALEVPGEKSSPGAAFSKKAKDSESPTDQP